MKKFGMVFMLTCVSATAFANNPAQVQRILSDTVLTAAETAIASKYSVNCATPTNTDFTWHCLNGLQCGYVVTITCVPMLLGEPGQLQLVVGGFDNGTKNDMHSLQVNGIESLGTY